jgi:hypothetical protein
MEHYKERDRRITLSGTCSNLVCECEKLKDQKNVANSFSTFFITVTEKLNI